MRSLLPTSLLIAALVVGGSARADERVECARSYEQAQRLQQQNEVGKALEAAERCARPTCPALLADECRPWVTQLRQQLPRLEVHARGSDGCLVRDPQIEVDRVKQPGANIAVDIGIHEVRVVDPASGRAEDKTVNLSRNDRRTLEFSFAPEGVLCPEPSDVAAPARPIPKSVIGLGIAGGVLLFTGISLGVVGALKRSDLDSCKPGCSADAIDGTRTFFVAGDVVGGIGLATLAASVLVYVLTQPGDGRSSAVVTHDGLRLRF